MGQNTFVDDRPIHNSADVPFTPAGGVSATTVQAAIEELDSEKLAKASNLSDLANAATAFSNIKQAATDAVTGVVELATNAETVAGTAADRAITPAGLTAKIDTDVALSGNLDTRIPSQKAVKTYVDGLVGASARDLVYGVKWNTANTSPTLTKCILIDEQWVEIIGTVHPIQNLMKRCVMSSSGSLIYYLDANDSIYKAEQTTPFTAGTTDGSLENKLICSSETFVTKGVQAGMWVKNTTDNTYALITAVDSETQLSICYDIFASGEGFAIGTANPQADGCVMSEIPYFHYIWVEDLTNTYILISRSPFSFRKPISGELVVSQLHPAFTPGGAEQEHAYIGSFESVWYSSAAGGYSDHDGSTVGASGDKSVSLPGYKPLTYQYRRGATSYQGFAGLHAEFGSDYRTQSFFEYEALWILMITEWGTLNGQAALPGYTDANTWDYDHTRKTGRTMGLGNSSGSVIIDLTGIDSDLSGVVALGKAVANSYRGVENPFGHIWKWIDGINIYWVGSGPPMTSGRVYISNNPAVWAEDTSTNYEDTGLSFALSTGWASALHPGRLLVKSIVGGGSSYYLCDYFWPATSAGWSGLLAGAGGIINGVYAGPATLNALSSGSGNRYLDVGGRAAAKKS